MGWQISGGRKLRSRSTLAKADMAGRETHAAQSAASAETSTHQHSGMSIVAHWQRRFNHNSGSWREAATTRHAFPNRLIVVAADWQRPSRERPDRGMSPCQLAKHSVKRPVGTAGGHEATVAGDRVRRAAQAAQSLQSGGFRAAPQACPFLLSSPGVN